MEANELRYGNIVYYDDYASDPKMKGQGGYPIVLKPEFFPLGIPDLSNPFGVRKAEIKGMFFRCQEFLDDNKHLGLSLKDIPEELEHLHQFMNWYADKHNGGEQPEIFRGGKSMNPPPDPVRTAIFPNYNNIGTHE